MQLFKNGDASDTISTIIPGKLYLGSEEAGKSDSLLKSLGIKGIVNVTPNVPCLYPDKFKYMQIAIEDGTQGIDKFFDQTNEFIENNQPVLVHCSKGMSRSATIVIAYLMNENKASFQESLSLVKSKRSIVNPHFYFQCELLQYESTTKPKEKILSP